MKPRVCQGLGVVLLLVVVLSAPPQVGAAASWMEVADEVGKVLNEAVSAYAGGEVEAALKLVDDAYFGPFEEEGMEAAVKMNISAVRAFELEYGFTEIKQFMKKGAPVAEVEQKVNILMEMVRQDALALSGSGEASPWSGFVSAFLIIVREGMEAILILVAIIAYLVKTGNGDRVGTIYRSALAAVGASLLTAWLVGTVFKLSGAAQEVLEGVTMLLATVVLFFVSYWLLSKVEAQKWQQYIRGKVEDSLSTGSGRALWWVVFLAVYREGAETVLFYQALLSRGNPVEQVVTGFLVGSVVLVVVFVVVRLGSVRLPLRPFFAVTGVLLYYMAFTFAGQGVKELQESGLVAVSSVPGVPVVDFLGIYPTWQSLGVQGVLLLAALYAFIYQWRQSRGGGDGKPESARG